MHRTACLSTRRRRRHYSLRYSPRCYLSPGRRPRLGCNGSRPVLAPLRRLPRETVAGIRWRDQLATIKGLQTVTEFLVKPGQLRRACMVVLFKQPERFPNDFACGIVTARFHFGAHEFLQL